MRHFMTGIARWMRCLSHLRTPTSFYVRDPNIVVIKGFQANNISFWIHPFLSCELGNVTLLLFFFLRKRRKAVQEYFGTYTERNN